MDIRPRGFSADNIIIDFDLSEWQHYRTVPDFEYSSKEKAIKELNKLGFEVLAKEIIIKGCEHHGTYHEIYIKSDPREDFF